MGTIYTTGYVLYPQNYSQAINKVIARLKNVVVQYESRIFANRDGCGFTEHSHIQ